MKRFLLLIILVFPLATLLFWIWVGMHGRKTLPQATPGDTNFPTLSTNSPTR
jgi:hypothetical protein